MLLVWKLLRKHVSIAQLSGFFFANLFGMLVVLLGFQFYRDVLPIFTDNDSFMKADYLIVSKKIGMGTTLSGRANAFSDDEAEEFQSQTFVKKIGCFTASDYRVDAVMGVDGHKILNSEIYFESVPDEFVDVSLAKWKYRSGSNEIPIILPRIYINMYNFGFAQSRSLPKIGEGLMGMIDFDIMIRGNGKQGHFKGRVIGFSGRLNTILVPRSFMDWSNAEYGTNEVQQPTRLIVEVANPASDGISKYLDRKGYELETDKLDAERTAAFLRLMVFLVMGIGLFISVLSFYILMLSIYLLVQKNASKLENLLLIGYSPAQVSRPYQLLTTILNAAVLILSLTGVFMMRHQYMRIIELLFPNPQTNSIWQVIVLGLVILMVVTLFNWIAIARKINRIRQHRDIT